MGKPRSESRFQIFKFGGELEGDALKHAAGLVRSAAPDVFVVTSADERATDLLLDLVRCANGADRPQARRLCKAYADRQLELIRGAVAVPEAAKELGAMVHRDAAELAAICERFGAETELSRAMVNSIWARAARASATLFAAVLEQEGVQAKYVDAAPLIPTEAQAGRLWPDFPKCEAATKALAPLLERNIVVVAPGEVASGASGEEVMLG